MKLRNHFRIIKIYQQKIIIKFVLLVINFNEMGIFFQFIIYLKTFNELQKFFRSSVQKLVLLSFIH